MVDNKQELVSLYGLYIDDEQSYARYREGMEPILRAYGGRFGYDFDVRATLRSERSKRMNRVFTIVFDSAESKARFFEDPAYLSVRAKHFEPAVQSVDQLAEFQAPLSRTSG